jgi:nicotinamidase-related amidase
MTKGLIIVDVQNDYFDGGSMELVNMDTAANNCRQLLEEFRRSSSPIFHIQHLATREGATFFVPGTEGCETHDSVKPIDNEVLLTKNYPNSFRETGLDQILREANLSNLVVCGAMSHMCIDSTVRAAFDLGYSCELIADACATRDLEFEGKTIDSSVVHASFMVALNAPFASVTTTKDFLKLNDQ